MASRPAITLLEADYCNVAWVGPSRPVVGDLSVLKIWRMEGNAKGGRLRLARRGTEFHAVYTSSDWLFPPGPQDDGTHEGRKEQQPLGERTCSCIARSP